MEIDRLHGINPSLTRFTDVRLLIKIFKFKFIQAKLSGLKITLGSTLADTQSTIFFIP